MSDPKAVPEGAEVERLATRCSAMAMTIYAAIKQTPPSDMPMVAFTATQGQADDYEAIAALLRARVTRFTAEDVDVIHREIHGRAQRNPEAGVMFPESLLSAALFDFARAVKARLAERGSPAQETGHCPECGQIKVGEYNMCPTTCPRRERGSPAAPQDTREST